MVDDNADSARRMAVLQTRRGHVTPIVFTGFDEHLPKPVNLDALRKRLRRRL